MYLQQTQGYLRGTEQHVRRAPFLVLVDHYEPEPGKPLGRRLPLRAFVRKVALHQCGHFMMGATRVHGVRVPLSGCYGGDGLPREVDRATYDRATPVPAELEATFWAGGGHNGSGSEANDMYQWGRKLAGLE
jgi:hypothetical protein